MFLEVKKSEVSTVDRTEYRLKLDEMSQLVEEQDYEGALVIAEAIDWKRVKSVRTLCMVADIYEVNGKLKQSMEMLQLAYKRSTIGKMILYRQVELSLKMGEYDQAVKFYNQYLETAPNDTSKYILKYKIYRAQKAPLEEQISILEEYKDREYTERWVYELAKLYKKAGKQNKCIETCDDLILWFGDGKYVNKAMELKMTYMPLNPEQKVKYEKWNKTEEKVKVTPKMMENKISGISAAAMENLKKVSTVPEYQSEAEIEPTTGDLSEVAVTTEPELPMEAETVSEPEPQVDPEQLQKRLEQSFQEVLSGINRSKVIDSLEALGKSSNSEIPTEVLEEDIQEYHVTNLEPEIANENIILAEEKISVTEKTEVPEEKVEVEEVKEVKESEVTSVQELDLEALFAETSNAFAEEIKLTEAVEEEPQEVSSEEMIEESQESSSDESVESETDEETSDPEFAEITEALEDTLKKIETENTPSEEEEDLSIGDTQNIVLDDMDKTKEIKLDVLEEIERQCDEEERKKSLGTLEEETPEEKRNRILNATRPERLTDEQKRLFSYFSKVPGMDEQILDAIHGVYRHADEKTSHRGNIAIMGSRGTGKTRLSEGLVKAICSEFGLEATKFANIDAIDINKKDPATIIGKMAGGFLLIERASYMSSITVEKLSQAMEFRTDSMILMIEDEKSNMRKLLATYPEFAKKFETVISIPVFTNDELVTFARTYAKENGYKMDEMGVLALYTLIGENQRDDEPITIADVKEMVDKAIRKAEGKQFGRRISKRHTDVDGRILLYEKDFDL